MVIMRRRNDHNPLHGGRKGFKIISYDAATVEQTRMRQNCIDIGFPVIIDSSSADEGYHRPAKRALLFIPQSYCRETETKMKSLKSNSNN